ncbi:hypothetical protein P152DRAFT_446642 [Eremomyces bilateralis CBS 781.70]|uniref:Uncharacterized protein n=1 Tax=Eremomyces bilateralis CBS 781.70 TaxID=1392243 RepID=A0A6G1GBX7_9PEZI|nr:uncharacterized protein P152DRAFT_446642 [Eremomyces bilateralis CBS 781.70]KAF1815595.1 hypothetical protein P152DRAFT_446642 [Eremomyces bilateralis CBS 781.70]
MAGSVICAQRFSSSVTNTATRQALHPFTVELPIHVVLVVVHCRSTSSSPLHHSPLIADFQSTLPSRAFLAAPGFSATGISSRLVRQFGSHWWSPRDFAPANSSPFSLARAQGWGGYSSSSDIITSGSEQASNLTGLQSHRLPTSSDDPPTAASTIHY